VKLIQLLRFAPLLALGAFAPLSAETAPAPAPALAADSALAVAAYPLTTCVISGDKLEDGDMGAPINYIHKEAEKPDRLVRLCCKGCIKTFNKAPAKYLALIDAAAAAKATSAPSPAQVAPTP
jgi:hypothetical protein